MAPALTATQDQLDRAVQTTARAVREVAKQRGLAEARRRECSTLGESFSLRAPGTVTGYGYSRLTDPLLRGPSMKQPTVAGISPRGVAIPGFEPLAAALKHHMGLYQAPRVALVAQFLQQYGERRPIPVAEILPVILMNYGEVEFHHAQTWFEAGEEAPGFARPSVPHRCGGGIWAGRIGVWLPPLYGDRD